MSLRNTDVRTPGIAAIAKKFNLPIAKVMLLVKQGAKHEKEHNTDEKKAEQVARDHIGERPDYYKMLKKAEKSKVSLKESTYSGDGGVRGLGYVSGDPAAGIDYVGQYINTNAMAYEDQNGNILKMLKKAHDKHANLGFTEFNPNDSEAQDRILGRDVKIKTQLNKIRQKLQEEKKIVKELAGVERTSADGGVAGLPKSAYRENEIKEGVLKDKAKRVAMAGVTAANMYTMADVMSRAAEGDRQSSAKHDLVKVASALPGIPGWTAMGVNYAKQGFDAAKKLLKDKAKSQSPLQKNFDQYRKGKLQEATYKGKEVSLNKPMKGDVKKSKVFVDPDGDGKAQKVNFGDKKLSIKKDQPSRKKSYCARSGGIKGKGDVTSANYWSRKAWNCEEQTISEITADLVGRAMALSAAKRKKLTSGKMGGEDVKKWWKHQRLIDAGTAKLTGKSKVAPTVKDKKLKKEDVYTRPYEKNSPSNLEDLAVEPRTRAGRVKP
ncbi:hypothetical protein EB001_19680 [bacterium]|nr:hypothetical protein [bacterium]